MSKLLIQGKLYKPIKVGDPGDWYENYTDSVCGDCGSKFEEQHLFGCDIERCPAMIVEFDRNGPSGNIYAILALAQEQLQEHLPEFDFHKITDKVYASHSYNDALKIIDEYVTLIDVSRQSEM